MRRWLRLDGESGRTLLAVLCLVLMAAAAGVRLAWAIEPDYDADSWPDAAGDNHPLSRAVMRWGDPPYTTGNVYAAPGPVWWLGAQKVGGEWLTNGWHVAEAESKEAGALLIYLDRATLTNLTGQAASNVVIEVALFDQKGASLFVDLLDENHATVATNLFGNLFAGSNQAVTVTFDVPWAAHPDAATIKLRRGAGEVTVCRTVVYVDEDSDGFDEDQEAQLLISPPTLGENSGGGGGFLLSSSSLVGWWELDEGSGTTANDSSGSGNTGTLTDGPIWTNGVAGFALKFDGTNDYVNVAHASSIDMTGPFTVSTFARFDSLSSPNGWEAGLVAKGATETEWARYALAFSGNDGSIFLYSGDGYSPQSITSTQKVVVARWYHLVGLLRGTGANQAEIWIDGVKTGEGTLNYPSSHSGDLYIGRWRAPDFNFNGRLDDVRLYDYAISSNDVAALYNLDTDGDGLINLAELNTYGTDPENPDTDGDTMPDGFEVQHGSNPLVVDPLGDADSDGFSNLEEYIQTLNAGPDGAVNTNNVATIRYYFDVDGRLTDAFYEKNAAGASRYSSGHNLNQDRMVTP